MKNRTKTDFSANPHNIEIGDWVIHEGQRAKTGHTRWRTKFATQPLDKGQRKVIGKVSDRVDNAGDMLQFWVSWFDSISKAPTPELASNLIKIPKSEDGYVGKEISSGLISSMIWQDEQIKYEVFKNKQTIVKTREQIDSALNSQTVNINSIIIDHNLQQRVTLDDGVIDDYAIAYQEGVEFPPITIWKCTEDNKVYLVDGFHRAKAAKQARINELPFIEKSGTYREALLFSLGVNATHGLRRSNADKRKAVMTLLEDSEWSTWSNRTIASQCQVSSRFVDKLRKQAEELSANNFLVI